MCALNFSSAAAAVMATSTKLPKYHLPPTLLLSLTVTSINSNPPFPTILLLLLLRHRRRNRVYSPFEEKFDLLPPATRQWRQLLIPRHQQNPDPSPSSSFVSVLCFSLYSCYSSSIKITFFLIIFPFRSVFARNCSRAGNICRSPAAEGVFRSLVSKRGLDSRFLIDSAGTIGYHEGNLADPRMRAASKKRGIEITSISRPIKPRDFRDFDLILAMDKQNQEDILSAYERWSFKETLPENAQRKVKLMCSYCKKHRESEVPDPYYGGPQGFEKVLDLLEDACESLLDSVLAENK